MSDRPTAEAVAAGLEERFRARRERGQWFRATPLEVRKAIGTGRSSISTAARKRSRGRPTGSPPRLPRRRRQRRWLRRARRNGGVCANSGAVLPPGCWPPASPRSQPPTRSASPSRTIRNWTKDKAFQRTLARAQARAERQDAQRGATRRPQTRHDRRTERRPPTKLRSEQDPDPKPDERDARLPLTHADLHSQSDRVAASAVAAGERYPGNHRSDRTTHPRERPPLDRPRDPRASPPKRRHTSSRYRPRRTPLIASPNKRALEPLYRLPSSVALPPTRDKASPGSAAHRLSVATHHRTNVSLSRSPSQHDAFGAVSPRR